MTLTSTLTTESLSAANRVDAFCARPRQLLIDGEWSDAVDGGTLDAVNPATGRVITTIVAGGAEDINRAVGAARRALVGDWACLSPMDRGRVLERLATAIEANADEMALLESRDNGKPVSVARAVDLGSSVKLFRYFAGWPSKFEGATIPVSPRGGIDVLNYTRHQPVGVVGAIVPWNFPLSMACWKLAPALAMGNTVVLKPAEDTSLSTLRLGELLHEAGVPPGVVNIVTGTGASAGAALAAHAGVDKIAFTGSTEIGRRIATAATANMKRVGLELGGKSPHIIFPDADLDRAAQAAADAIFFNQGQVCTAGSRLYVHADVWDDVMERVVQHAEQVRVGPGDDPATQMGPLVSHHHRDRVEHHIRSGTGAGATVATGGGRPDLDEPYASGAFLEPTVFCDVDPGMSIVREEIFGPVLVASPWRDIDEVIAAANDTPYGLSAGLWTNDLSTAHRTAAAIDAGTVWVNCYNLTDPASPFGGFKQSGWGREMGRAVLEQYTETKSIWINLDRGAA